MRDRISECPSGRVQISLTNIRTLIDEFTLQIAESVTEYNSWKLVEWSESGGKINARKYYELFMILDGGTYGGMENAKGVE